MVQQFVSITFVLTVYLFLSLYIFLTDTRFLFCFVCSEMKRECGSCSVFWGLVWGLVVVMIQDQLKPLVQCGGPGTDIVCMCLCVRACVFVCACYSHAVKINID